MGAYYAEEYGIFYLWGYTDCDIETGTQVALSNISKTEYDVAHVKWGYGWRIPSKKEFQELINKCTWAWTKRNGVWGYTVTGPSGKSIFLPCGGFRNNKVHETSIHEDYTSGGYWSASSLTNLMFAKTYHKMYDWNNWINTRETIRPVINYNETTIEDVSSDAQPTTKEYYTFDGKKVPKQKLTKGFYIIRFSNGTTKKLYMK